MTNLNDRQLAVKVGNRFLGAYGYADHLAGRDNRHMPGWKGAVAGYLDGLPAAAKEGVLVDANGLILRIGRRIGGIAACLD